MQCDEDCRTAGFGKTERPVGWEGDGELSRVKLVRHCERGKPAGTDRLHLQALSHSFTLGLLYLHVMDGDVALVEATPEGYREKGRFTPPAQPKHKQAGQYPEQAFAYPVIANGRLYIRDLGTLWAYDIKASR